MPGELIRLEPTYSGPRCQGPHSDILMIGGGGGRDPTEVHILYPPKIPTSEFVYPKKSLLFQHTQKNPTLAVNCAYVIADLADEKYNT